MTDTCPFCKNTLIPRVDRNEYWMTCACPYLYLLLFNINSQKLISESFIIDNTLNVTVNFVDKYTDIWDISMIDCYEKFYYYPHHGKIKIIESYGIMGPAALESLRYNSYNENNMLGHLKLSDSYKLLFL